MNLRNLQSALLKIDVNALGTFTSNRRDGAWVYSGTNLDGLRATLDIVEKIPVLKRYADAANATSLSRRPGDTLEFTNEDFSKLYTATSTVSTLVPTLISALNELNGNEKPYTIYIKLPDTNDLVSAAQTLVEINKIISQVINHPSIGGHLTLTSWQNGSLWIELAVGSSLAVHTIGKLVNSAALAYREILKNRYLEEQVNAVAVRAASMEDLRVALQKNLQLLIDAEARQLYNGYIAGNKEDAGNENDQIERIKYSIKTLSELLDKGAEIHPSLLAPQEEQKLFPDMKALPKLLSDIKQLKS